MELRDPLEFKGLRERMVNQDNWAVLGLRVHPGLPGQLGFLGSLEQQGQRDNPGQLETPDQLDPLVYPVLLEPQDWVPAEAPDPPVYLEYLGLLDQLDLQDWLG